MNEDQFRRLVTRLCELHGEPRGAWVVWTCGPHVFKRPTFDPDLWYVDGKLIRSLDWPTLMTVGSWIADCAWD